MDGPCQVALPSGSREIPASSTIGQHRVGMRVALPMRWRPASSEGQPRRVTERKKLSSKAKAHEVAYSRGAATTSMAEGVEAQTIERKKKSRIEIIIAVLEHAGSGLVPNPPVRGLKMSDKYEMNPDDHRLPHDHRPFSEPEKYHKIFITQVLSNRKI